MAISNEHRLLAGEFSRERNVSLDEGLLMAALLEGGDPGVMIDVGAHHGGSAKPFLERGWRVLAFEPDHDNRAVLERLHGKRANLTIDPRAVGSESEAAKPFYASEESTGISGLSAFTPGHREVGAVDVVDLETALAEQGLDRVDYLKIDTEGFDLFVLQGFPWSACRPRAVLCEFEDAKTLPLGYGFHDLCAFLTERGYRLLISEWHPILRYGIQHQFKRLATYPSELTADRAWGNVLALDESLDLEGVDELTASLLKKG